jgi:hypothetical protein
MFPVNVINKVSQKPNNTKNLLGPLKSKIFLTGKNNIESQMVPVHLLVGYLASD